MSTIGRSRGVSCAIRLFYALLLLCAGDSWAQQTPIARSARFTGNINFVATGGSLRSQSNSSNACAVNASSTSSLSGVPAGASVLAAYLYWGGSGSTADTTVTLNGSSITATRSFTATYSQGGTDYPYFGAVANVTSLVSGNGSFTVSGLTVATGNPWCATQAVAGGWSLIAVYQRAAEPLRAINLFDGLQLFRGSSLTLMPDGFRVPPAGIDGRIGVVTLEGDPGNSGSLNGVSETLQFNGTALDDGLVPAGSDPAVQQYDGTVNSQGIVTSHGFDVDVYDVAALLAPGQTTATTVYASGADLVLLLAQIVSVTTEPGVDLAITKAHTGDFAVGTNGSYTLRVTNAAGLEREDNLVTVADVLPAGLTYVSGNGTGWSCAAAAQTVTCTHAPPLDAGAALPDLTLTVAVDASAAATVTNSASVSSASLDFEPANDTASDPTVVRRPDLSGSTKTVVDLNGGEANPGDTLRYTVTLIESGGVAASGVRVTDDIPANVTGFTVVSIPAGATNASSGAGSGANGTGFLDVSGIALAAGASATVVLDVVVAAGATPGTLIENTATVVNPLGPGAAPTAPQLVVSPSQIPGNGTKALYLRSSPGIDLSRNPPGGGEASVNVPASGANAITWALTPALALPVSIPAGNIATQLWISRSSGGTSNRTLAVTLANSITGPVGTTTQSVSGVTTNPAAPQQLLVTIPNAVARTFPAGSTLTLTIAQTAPASGPRFTRIHPNGSGAGNSSRVELASSSVINVDSVGAYDAAWPAGTEPASFGPGATLWIRAVVSDPFGSFDIARANLTLLDPANVVRVNAALMNQVADSGAATRTYEYSYTLPSGAPAGNWMARVVGTEGTEGTVTDLNLGGFTLAVPQPTLIVVKTSQALTDPVNAGVNAKRIPGGVTRYEISLTNNGPGAVDASSLVITDVLPADTELYVASAGGDPIEFIDGATPSGLGFVYASEVRYSNQPGGGAPFDYTPVPDADGFDANVRGLRIAPSGVMNGASGAATPSFTVRFRVRVR